MVRRRFVTSVGAVLAALTAVSGMAADAALPRTPGLVAVGPISPAHGFPVWYRDANGTTLEQCLDGANPLCAFPPGAVPDPTQPISFPSNFPGEAFYMLAGANMTTSNGGLAGLTLALEGAFANAKVVPGDQVVFGRIRLRVDNLVPGATYTVTHPYGVETFTDVSGGLKSINFTDDVGIAPGIFTGALNSRIGPFLSWDPIVEAPAGYLGDPNVNHRVSGSPYGTNVFRIEGPNVGAPGSPFLCTPTSLDCIQTDLFSLMAKRATTSGVAADAAQFSRTPDGQIVLDVYAHTDPFDNIRIKGQGVATTELAADKSGRYYARVDVNGPVPPTITITNLSDQPPTVVTTKVVDKVAITRADYDADAKRLTIQAESSDRGAPVVLTAEGYGQLTAGMLVVDNVVGPPAKVTVTSSAGGSETVTLSARGRGFAPVPVRAFAGPDRRAQQGQTVLLDGTASSGDVTSYTWKQTAGTPVQLSSTTTVQTTFTAPAAAGTLSFELKVEGPGGPSTHIVNIVVEDVVPPVADAGPDQTVIGGRTVTLDGSRSTGASAYSWAQVGGPLVSLTGANTAAPTFRYPPGSGPLTFQLTVEGPGGIAADTVKIKAVDDVLTVTVADFRSSKGDWRIEGTATVPGPGNSVTIRIGNTAAGPILATVDVDPLGNWVYRATNKVTPDATASVSIISAVGGQKLGVPLTIRR